MGEHTPLPWTYRPHKYDDWGFIRGPKDGLMSVGPIAAIARGESDQSHDEHRAAKTDPYAANAALIVKAVNCHEMLVKTLEGIAEFCSGDDATLGALSRLAHIRNTALTILGHVGPSGDGAK